LGALWLSYVGSGLVCIGHGAGNKTLGCTVDLTAVEFGSPEAEGRTAERYERGGAGEGPGGRAVAGGCIAATSSSSATWSCPY